ncbi:hypothetical protein AB0J82_25635 [Asanoa sp. NPDC049518]|uniref:hypothetical protein n=1 Tax=unclassified Asanoa TaxID=2685164 RepID=UPI0034312B4F
MTGMRDLLVDVAAEARPYDVTDQALRTARRQRRIAWLAPVAAVVLATAGVAAVLPHSRPANSTVVSWLPEKLDVAESTSALPDSRLGLAVLAYTRADGSTVLVADDGGHYDAGEGVRAISPDGRWVALVRDGRVVLRDLGGDRVVDLGSDDDTNVAAWSSDGRWLAVRSGVTNHGAPQSVMVIELATGRQAAKVAAGDYGTTVVCGLRDSAFLLLCSDFDNIDEVSLSRVNPLTGDDLGRQTVDLNKGVTKSFFVGGELMPDGHTLAFRTEGLEHAAGDLLTFDLSRPNLRPRHHNLPVPTRDERALRQVQSSVDGGVIVTRRYGQDLRIAAVELLDFAGDRVETITTVRGDIRDIVVRGQV